MILNAYSENLTLSSKLLFSLLFLISANPVIAQNVASPQFKLNYQERISFSESDSVISSYPAPKSILRKSLIIPGWGQISNKQIWKVPIVYGLIGGLAYYSTVLTKNYHDYRAAYYNVINGDESDFRFGQTPAYITSTNQTLLRSRRNNFRNRRDFMYVAVFLAYALNAIDAYVYAHLRTFDVSDDLSMNMYLKPNIMRVDEDQSLGISLNIDLFTK